MKHIIITIIIFLAAVSCKSHLDQIEQLDLNPQEDTTGKLSYLALGDSYTIGHNVAESERWSVQLVKMINENEKIVSAPLILAKTGWTTRQLINAINASATISTSQYDVVSLMIGVNNQYQGQPVAQFRQEFKQLLTMSLSLAGNDPKRVFVISIPDWGVTPAGGNNQEEIAKEIDAFNKVEFEECQEAQIEFIDVTPLSRTAKGNPSLVAKDDLHFSGEMYRKWADLILQKTKTIFKKQT